MRIFAALAFAFFVIAPANAAEKPTETTTERQILAPGIVTPVVREGKLANYLFVSVQVDLADGANVLKLRDRAHFLRDSLLRASHRADLADPVRDDKLNTVAAKAAFTAAAHEALGSESVKAVTITGVDSLRRR